MEKSKEISLFELDDKICDMNTDMEKARVLLEQLEYEHFNIPNIKTNISDIGSTDSPIFNLAWDYDKNHTIFEIMFDYIVNISNQIDQLYEQIKESDNKDTAA